MTEPGHTSPCISLCQLDSNDVCKGCFRSAEEIRNWIYFDSEQRKAVLDLCAERALSKKTDDQSEVDCFTGC